MVVSQSGSPYRFARFGVGSRGLFSGMFRCFGRFFQCFVKNWGKPT